MKRHQSKTRHLTVLAMCTTVALLLSYVEFLLPPLFVAVPGIKMGLPNIAIIFVLYSAGVRSAAAVSLVRLTISSMLFGSAMTFAYSLAGAVLSLTVMALLKRLSILSAVGVSVAGGVMHNVGQILVAIFLLNTPQIAYYMIVLAVTGTISGILVGLCGAYLIKKSNLARFLK